MENKNHRHSLQEQMLVIVNQDWNRAYIASVKVLSKFDERARYSAKCKMTDSFIIGTARDKKQLSECMNEMATIVEEYKLDRSQVDTYNIAGIGWNPN